MNELALHVLDLVQNSLTAGASTVEIHIDEDLAANELKIIIKDNGRGMSLELLQRVLDPFTTTRTTRKVGLGLPLLQFAAETAGGGVTISSEVGVGTTVEATFRHDHIDRAPLGSMAETLGTLIALNEDCRFYYRHRVDEREFVLDSREIEKELEEVPLSHPEVVAWLKEYISENERLLEV